MFVVFAVLNACDWLGEFTSPDPLQAAPPACCGAQGPCGALVFAEASPAPRGFARSWAVLMVMWLLAVELPPK